MNEEAKNNIIYGDQNFFVPSHLNVGAFILENILTHNRHTAALINGATGEQITYSDMAQNIINIAASLTRLGVKSGDVVAIFSRNRIEYILTTLAVFYIGAVVTFFNVSYTKDDLIHAINISTPKYMFLSGEMYKSQFENIENVKIINKYIVYDEVSALRSNCLYFKELVKWQTDIKSYLCKDFQGKSETCMILYSSGTTGLAKGANITHRSMISICHQPMAVKRMITPFIVAPWSSTMGIMCTLREIFYGRTLVFLPKYNEILYLETIQKYKIGILIVAPPLIVTLVKSTTVNEFDISSVEIVYGGGASINPKVVGQLKTRFPHIKYVLQGYGMTEATGAVTEELEIAPKQGSVGKVVPGIIIKISDPETNKTLGCREPGEVRLKGQVVFGGYIGRDMQNDIDDEGFYKTGDIAYYDQDGYFYIVDRIKELIKYKAWQVPPSELEALILQHPAVKDVGVTGAPDMLAGELPTAFVVSQPDTNVTEQEIIDYVADKVAPWKRLRGGVIFLKEIPKTPSGKILRRKLQALLSKQSLRKLPASKL